MNERHFVETWDKPALQAASMSCGPCEDVFGVVGIDMIAQDGNTFAHGHFYIEAAEQFHRNLGDAITAARKRL